MALYFFLATISYFLPVKVPSRKRENLPTRNGERDVFNHAALGALYRSAS